MKRLLLSLAAGALIWVVETALGGSSTIMPLPAYFRELGWTAPIFIPPFTYCIFRLLKKQPGGKKYWWN
ncbi:MAG: hypothetical protein V4480_00835 [Patescibacteria group bacterium]